jgi:toxin ParE1/3/4
MTWTVRFSGPAAKDYVSILKRSKKLHGEVAANRYTVLLNKALETIGTNPFAGKPLKADKGHGALALHLRYVKQLVSREQRVKSPRHIVIYFTMAGDTVLISRILHDAMDVARHKLPRKS